MKVLLKVEAYFSSILLEENDGNILGANLSISNSKSGVEDGV